ncbi:hypothetical protein MPLB_1380009 [Mesorhizobium sp. ORS 3324]|nr:hypothetical protein MPLB_1380009 [Mesorhizobium sp. ORS 3324]
MNHAQDGGHCRPSRRLPQVLQLGCEESHIETAASFTGNADPACAPEKSHRSANDPSAGKKQCLLPWNGFAPRLGRIVRATFSAA